MCNLFENFKLVYGCKIGKHAIYLNVSYHEKQIEREIVLHLLNDSAKSSMKQRTWSRIYINKKKTLIMTGL